MSHFPQARSLIPKGNLVEVGFAELDADPIATLRYKRIVMWNKIKYHCDCDCDSNQLISLKRRIYTELGWTHFEEARPKLEAYLSTLTQYEKNSFNELKPELKEFVYRYWKDSFTDFGYKP